MNYRMLEHKDRREVKIIRHKIEDDMREEKQYCVEELDKFVIQLKKEFRNTKEEI